MYCLYKSAGLCYLQLQPEGTGRYLGDVCQWLLILHQHLGKLQALLWVDPHHVPQEEDPVWGVAHLEQQDTAHYTGHFTHCCNQSPCLYTNTSVLCL